MNDSSKYDLVRYLLEANPTGELATRPTVAEFSPQQILAQIASIYILPAVFLQPVSHEETSSD